jgi:hypothetical protein
MVSQSDQVAGSLTKAMEDAASKAPREVRDKLIRANRLWSQEIQGNYTEDIVTKLVDGQPFEAVEALLKTQSPHDVHVVRSMVERGAAEATKTGNTAYAEVWGKAQGALLTKLVDQASEAIVLPGGTVSTARKINWEELTTVIDEATNASKGEIWRAWGVEPQVNRLREIANFGRFAQGKAGGSEHAIFFNLMQAGSFGTLVGALNFADSGQAGASAAQGAGAAAAMVLLTPLGLNKLFTDPAINKWLSVGMAAGQGSQLARKAGTLLLTKALSDNWLYESEKPKARRLLALYQEQGGYSGEDVRLTESERAQVNSMAAQTPQSIMEDRVKAKGAGQQLLDMRAKALGGQP